MAYIIRFVIWILVLGLGVSCVPSAALSEDDIDPERETAVTIMVIGQNGDSVPGLELRYREDVNGFAVTHVVGEPTIEASKTPEVGDWQVADCYEAGLEDTCKMFIVRLACEKSYIIEAKHPTYQFDLGYVTTSSVNGRCRADQPELTLYEYEEVKVCTAIAISAVSFSVVDENGDKLLSARAAYHVDGGEWQVAEAIDYCSDGEICGGSFVAGWDQAGHYEIKIEADGYLPVTTAVDVTMEADGCHVDSEVLTIPLQPGASTDAEAILMCPDRNVPSMYIEVMNEAHQFVPWATVTYQIDGGEWLSPTCVNSEACSIFQAGEDQHGSFIIRAEKEGYQTALTVSNVPLHPNGCHVVTQRLRIILKPEE